MAASGPLALPVWSTPSALPSQEPRSPSSADAVTFNADIAPILFKNCAPCHRPGEVAPFSLLTYDDARRRASQIALVTTRRIMPPWKPEPGHGEFIGARRLSDQEIATIQRWVQHGAVEGATADLPPRPDWPDGWQLGTPDLVVTMPEPYMLAAAGEDVFRTFVIPASVATTRYVRALEFRPGGARIVHHASIRVDGTSSSRQLDEGDPLPGYEGITSRDAHFPEGYFLSWTPGQFPQVAEPDMAWRLDPGTDFVLQLHLLPGGKPEAVQSSLGLFFTDEAPTRKPTVLRLGEQNIDIAPGARDHVAEDSYRLPVDIEILSIQPHAHYRAREVRGWAVLPDGGETSLIRIDDWDFRWQDVYRYRNPVRLPKGTTLFMRYRYDNSADNPRNPRYPPERVIYGQRSTDEMADLWIQALTVTEEDRATLTRDMRGKIAREDIEGYQRLLSVDADNPGLHDDLALIYAETGDVARTIAEFETVVRLKPESAPARYNLGRALAMGGRAVEARQQYETSVALDPRYAPARNALGGLLVLQGALDDALRHLGIALDINPEQPEAHYNTGVAHALGGRDRAAAGAFREASRLRPDWPAPLADLARVLATSADAALRDPFEAVRVAERATALPSGRTANTLDALAVAYAAQERYDRAIAIAEEALQQAKAANLETAVSNIQARLDLYRQRAAGAR